MKISWINKKPTRSGAYWLKNFDALDSDATALIQVVRTSDGRLMCNLHCKNSAGVDECDWYPVHNLSPDMQWCGPLCPKPKSKRRKHDE